MAPELPPFPPALQAAAAAAARKGRSSTELGGASGSGEDPGPAGAGQGGGAGAEDLWQQFTPTVIDEGKCFARVWGAGRGGQCAKRRLEGKDYCGSHCEAQSRVHGDVRGDIPAPKFRQFLAEAAKRAKRQREEKAGSSAGGVAAAGQEVPRAPVGESSGAQATQGRGAGGGVASREEVVARRLRRAGFATPALGTGAGEEGVVSGRGAAGDAGGGVVARGGGRGRAVSGFGEERVDDVQALEELREGEACARQRRRRQEGARGRMVDFGGREMDRNEGGAFSLKR